MAIAIVLIVIVVASIAFHFLSPWWLTPAASNWGEIDDAFNLTLVITGAFFIVINLMIAWFVFKYRHRKGHKSTYQPDNKRLEAWLIGLTTVAIIGLLAPGLVVYGKFVAVPDDAKEVEVVGEQWKWSFRFPGEDNQLGKSDVRFISPTNPLGVDPDDPASSDDKIILTPELHLPLYSPYKVLLRSKDVLHDFNVPQFRAKMDMVPGSVTYFWLTPTQRGTFDILCAELCGVGHFNMRGRVVVEDDAQFGRWLAKQPTFAQTQQPASERDGPVTDPVEHGKTLSEVNGCIGCHSIDGKPGVGPTWQGLYGKTETLSDDTQVQVDDEYLKAAILNPNAEVVKGYPAIMPAYQFSDDELDAIIAYIKAVSSPQVDSDAGNNEKENNEGAE
ncbi:cytochrome c oxidase subunit II [Photobacterium rosenbergii]|uniref:cytochrome-c oxidase n=1 Tax=Photobacterium rosenbergii TaxID=294936 RepID=A0A2T3NM17_9GAMM|nr:cytochrome c oxidase subunit II [Photobacterium rosenbergii]MBY5944440.1 cytochrome c oxidase subunit II [Photobacterium rosenbergii]PSW16540.1 cytochrome B [Photobacterium rosenbergii]